MKTPNDGLEEVPPMINMSIWEGISMEVQFPRVKVVSQSFQGLSNEYSQ